VAGESKRTRAKKVDAKNDTKKVGEVSGLADHSESKAPEEKKTRGAKAKETGKAL
jgi:hypothetical protein